MKVDFNADADHIEIPNSKPKVLILILIGLGFAAAGIWFVTNPSTFMDSGFRHRPKLEVEIIGYVSIIFSVVALVGGLLMLFTNKPGLVINLSGILIGRATPQNIIRWSDIEKFGEVDISQQRLIQIYIKDPDEYIESQRNWFRRKLMEFTYKRYGVIFSISTTALKCDFDQLYDFLNDTLKIYQEDSKSLPDNLSKTYEVSKTS